MHSKACAVGRTQQAATDDTIAWPPEGDGLRRWENQRMLSSCHKRTKVSGPQSVLHFESADVLYTTLGSAVAETLYHLKILPYYYYMPQVE